MRGEVMNEPHTDRGTSWSEDSVIGNSPLNPHNRPVVPPFPEGGHPAIVRTLPTAWQSIPEAIRFAVWLWAVGTIVGAVAGVALGAAFLIGMAAR